MSAPVTLAASAWGDLAAEALGPHWLGRLWERDARGMVLVSEETNEALRLVEPGAGIGPLDVVVEGIGGEPWSGETPPYGWRVGRELWLGDALTVRLPAEPPFASAFDWRRQTDALDAASVARHLARLADWFLARAPEATLGGVLAEWLGEGERPLAERPDLPGAARLFRWRAARALGRLFPALAGGALGEVEETMRALAGLGAGTPPAGTSFVLGFIAGLQLWPPFLDQGMGLNEGPVVGRLFDAAEAHASLMGRSLLRVARAGHWSERWQSVGAPLAAAAPYADWPFERLAEAAGAWLDAEPDEASAALAGLLLPFLLHQQAGEGADG